MNLSESIALVTGAGHRVGRAIALALGSRGVDVAVHYGSSSAGAEDTVTMIEAAGAKAFSVQADLARPEEIVRLFEAVEGRFGGLDILVNSAATFDSAPLDEIDADRWDRVMAVNLRAPFLATREAARLMKQSDRADDVAGLIVNLTDLSALGVWRGFVHHSVSKAGLIQLTRASAWELAPGVRVNAIAPGAILPPPGQDPNGAEWQGRGESVPIGRVGKPEWIGDTVVALAENDFINGVILPVDGGEHLSQGGR